MFIGCLLDRSDAIILLEQILNMGCEMKQVDFKCCEHRVMWTWQWNCGFHNSFLVTKYPPAAQGRLYSGVNYRISQPIRCTVIFFVRNFRKK